ncbi:ABC transporter substrate-binding protein [uncultured Ruegeria sp.]|uniref:ABC transporter substrate-binding protein n=1 Tax=uncultured Ruegeria sp. TaxID=259304 RepID=UPI0026359146|nr:ABC transporter substrate-binding protein [uncultured Ruegeria sp.]
MKRRDFLKSATLTGLATAGYFSSTMFAAAQGRKTLTLAYPTSFPSLDPSTSFSNDNAVMANCYETLTRYIPDPETGSGTVSPLLAEKWESADEGRTWTFHLRSGVTFDDGAPLNAEAVKKSIERTKTLAGGASFIWDAVEQIETPDDMTVVLKLAYAQPMDVTVSAGYAAWILSPAAVEQDNEWFNAGNSGGTGPYKIMRNEPGQRCILARNENYWGGRDEDRFDNVVLEISEDPVLAQSMLESGQADWTYGLPYENLERMESNPDLDVVVNPSFQNLVGFMNTKKAPLDNVDVRRALAMSFPYDDVVGAGTNGLGSRARGAIPPGIWGHDPEAPMAMTNLEEAKSILEATGVTDLELTLTYFNGDKLEALASELWRANLATIGVKMNLQPMSWEAQWDLAKSDPANAQDIFMFYWWPTYVTPYDYLLNMFRSEDEPIYNLGYYSNPEFDANLDAAHELSASDRAASEQMFRDTQRMLIADYPAVFIMDLPNVHVVRSDIKGYVDNPAYAHVVFSDELSK